MQTQGPAMPPLPIRPTHDDSDSEWGKKYLKLICNMSEILLLI